MVTSEKSGKVILAGAGPGDPELITLKTVRYLQQADIVLTDRLVSEVILKAYIKPDAKVIRVGKQCRRGISTPQEEINSLLVEYALQGNLVVRLKGGDVSVFSNILDELQILQENNIPFEIVPGVTAALGAAAYAGIPLTARNHATAVRFLTLCNVSMIAETAWNELAQTNDTLVFYMSSETLEAVVEKLTHYSIDASKLLAVIEQATTPLQQVYKTNLYEYDRNLKGRKFLSPSLVIIGKVVALQEKFAWFEGQSSGEHYFKPLTAIANLISDENKEKRA